MENRTERIGQGYGKQERNTAIRVLLLGSLHCVVRYEYGSELQYLVTLSMVPPLLSL